MITTTTYPKKSTWLNNGNSRKISESSKGSRNQNSRLPYSFYSYLVTITKNSEIKLKIYKNLENRLEIYSCFKFENRLENFEFFVNGRWTPYQYVPFSVCRGKTSCWGCSFLWLRLSKHLSKDESFHYRESLTILVNASKATESRKSFSHAKTYSRVTWLQRWARGAQGLCMSDP